MFHHNAEKLINVSCIDPHEKEPLRGPNNYVAGTVSELRVSPHNSFAVNPSAHSDQSICYPHEETSHPFLSKTHRLISSRKHAYIILNLIKLRFYIVKLGFTGVYIIFLIFAQKHRLWVLVRTASSRWF